MKSVDPSSLSPSLKAGLNRESAAPGIVQSLEELIAAKWKYPTVYADPPWPYSNTAARGAAENHFGNQVERRLF